MTCVAFSPRGDRLAAGGTNLIVIWDFDTGKEISRCPLEDTTVHSLAFTPSGKQLVSGSEDGTVRLWFADTGEQLHSFNDHTDAVRSVAIKELPGRLYAVSGGGGKFTANRDALTPGNRDHALRLWDLKERVLVRRITGQSGAIHSVAFSMDGRLLVSGGDDHLIRIWDRETGKELRVLEGHKDTVRSIAVSPDGKYALSGADDCKLRLWDMPRSVDDLLLALKLRNGKAVSRAAQDLDVMGDDIRRAVPFLLASLKGGSEELARPSIGILRRLGRLEGLSRELAGLLGEKTPGVHSFACESLIALGEQGRAAVPQAVMVLQKNNEPAVWLDLLRVLEKIGGQTADLQEVLSTRGLTHAEADVREQTLAVLFQLFGEKLPVETIARVVRGDNSPRVLTVAERCLRQRVDEMPRENLSPARFLIKQTDSTMLCLMGLDVLVRLRADAAELVPDVIPVLQVKNARLRLRALRTCSRSASRRSRPCPS